MPILTTFALFPDDLERFEALPVEANLVLRVVHLELFRHTLSLFDLVLVDVDQEAGLVGLLVKLATLAEEHGELVDSQAHVAEEVLASVVRLLIALAILPEFLVFGGRLLSIYDALLVQLLLLHCATFLHAGLKLVVDVLHMGAKRLNIVFVVLTRQVVNIMTRLGAKVVLKLHVETFLRCLHVL